MEKIKEILNNNLTFNTKGNLEKVDRLYKHTLELLFERKTQIEFFSTTE